MDNLEQKTYETTIAISSKEKTTGNVSFWDKEVPTKYVAGGFALTLAIGVAVLYKYANSRLKKDRGYGISLNDFID